ncbi:MAG: response regulator transcription factor [Acidimicrobiia bacterium]
MEDRPDADGPIRVILAEDHALVREGTRRILEATGDIVVVAEATDGEAAVAAVARHEPDVAIIDIGMPGINGIEATRRIKASHPLVGVLILTMHDDIQFILTVIEAGAAGYLLKDVEGSQLIEAVKAIRAGDSVLHSTIVHKVFALLASGEQGQRHSDVEEPLTDRELEVLQLAARGMANKEICATLDISVRTVEAHLSHIFRKLDVGSRTEAIYRGLRHGWFTIDELEPPP